MEQYSHVLFPSFPRPPHFRPPPLLSHLLPLPFFFPLFPPQSPPHLSHSPASSFPTLPSIPPLPIPLHLPLCSPLLPHPLIFQHSLLFTISSPPPALLPPPSTPFPVLLPPFPPHFSLCQLLEGAHQSIVIKWT